MDYYSTLTVTNGSNINNNSGGVNRPRSLSLLRSRLVRQLIDRRSIAAKERLCDDREQTDTLRSHVRLLAVRRRSMRCCFFHTDRGERLKHRRQLRRLSELACVRSRLWTRGWFAT